MLGCIVFVEYIPSFSARASFTEQSGQLYIVSFFGGGEQLAQVAPFSASPCEEGGKTVATRWGITRLLTKTMKGAPSVTVFSK